MIALAAAAALVLTDARFTGTASARMETRARTATQADSLAAQNANAASDAEVTPSLFGAVDNLGGRLALSYSPTIRMREYYSNEVSVQGAAYRRTEVNHSQAFEARWSREGRPSPYLLESLYIGRVDLAAGRDNSTGSTGAGAPPTTGGDPNAPAGGTTSPVGFNTGQIYQTSFDLNGGVLWPLNRVMQLDTSVGYNYSSGLDQGARLVLPTQQSYRTQARLDYQLTPVDMLITQVDGRHSNFPGEQARFTIANAAQRWRRQIIASTALELGVLVGAFYSSYLQPPPVGTPGDAVRVEGTTFAPGGDATIRHRTGSARHVINLDTGVRVAPFIDRYVVAAFNRGEVFTTLAYTFRERWIFSTRGSAAMSLTPVAVRGVQSNANGGLPDIVTFGIDARAGYQAPRYWRLELYGLDSLYMIDGGTVHNWIVGLALTLRAEGQT